MMRNEAQLATTPAPQTAGPKPAQEIQCPRCHKPLIDPNGLGWCKTCGYCRSLELEKNNKLLAAAPGPSRGAVLAGAAGHIPLWFWVLLAGIAILAGLSLAAGRWLPPGNTLPRALWTSIQIGVGLALIFTGQLIAVVHIAPEDEKLSFKDAVVPTRLWLLVSKRLPRCCGCLWVSTWGLALVVFAVLFIGGLQHWFKYVPNSKNQVGHKAR
jgi:hypothetical protein